jgi:hypothetical protein
VRERSFDIGTAEQCRFAENCSLNRIQSSILSIQAAKATQSMAFGGTRQIAKMHSGLMSASNHRKRTFRRAITMTLPCGIPEVVDPAVAGQQCNFPVSRQCASQARICNGKS